MCYYDCSVGKSAGTFKEGHEVFTDSIIMGTFTTEESSHSHFSNTIGISDTMIFLQGSRLGLSRLDKHRHNNYREEL